MTRYGDDLDIPVVFAEQTVPATLAEVLADAGVRQLHVAETEKYAHVTYFFNGGRRGADGRARRGSSSRARATSPSYDLQPEMSADEVADRFCAEVGDGYGFALVNFANPDMVGHTGVIPAVVDGGRDDRPLPRPGRRAGRRASAASASSPPITATPSRLLEPDGVSPHTAHTTNPCR